jgi:hypothetical protein
MARGKTGEYNMKGSHLFWLSRSEGMTVDIWIRDYNPPMFPEENLWKG